MGVVTLTKRQIQARLRGELLGAVTRLSDPISRLRWLLAFAERDGRIEPGECRQLVADLRIFCALGGPPSIDPSAHYFPRRATSRSEVLWRPDEAAQELANLSREAAKAIEAVYRGEWTAGLPACRISLKTSVKGKPQKAITGDKQAIFLLAMWDLLGAESGRIGRCQECKQRFFVKRKRGAYCGPACSQRVRDPRFRENKSPEFFREYRHKVYVRQYAKKRHISEKSAAQKIRRRPARGSGRGGSPKR